MDVPWASTLTDWWDHLSPSSRLLWACLTFVVALLAGALFITVADRWRRKQPSDGAAYATDQLAHFRSLYEQGLLSPEEFERIRDKLGGRLRQELHVEAPRDGSPKPPDSSAAGGPPTEAP